MSIKQIYNYFELLVAEEIQYRVKEEYPNATADFLTDVACVALNRLPARYIRHKVDMAFYMPQDELAHSNKIVADAVSDAFDFVAKHHRSAEEAESEF